MNNSKKSTGHTATDAITLLKADHQKVKELFRQFEALQDGDSQNKSKIVAEICHELSIHAQVEEEIFYPAMRSAMDDEALMDEADVEHAAAKGLIKLLEAMAPGDDHYAATVTVLGEEIDHHVHEEEGKMFPKAIKARVNIALLGEQIIQRKQELEAQHSRLRPAATGNKRKPAQHEHR